MITVLNVAAGIVAATMTVGILMPSAPGWRTAKGAVANAVAAASLAYLAMFAILDVAVRP